MLAAVGFTTFAVTGADMNLCKIIHDFFGLISIDFSLIWHFLNDKKALTEVVVDEVELVGLNFVIYIHEVAECLLLVANLLLNNFQCGS